jgi:NAD-dependent deacetylase
VLATDLESRVEAAARTLIASRYAIALVGAGISVESGIRPFRGKGGLWTEKGEPPMDGYRRWMEDPAAAWRGMLERRSQDDEFSRSLRDAHPNPAHLAFAQLERMGILRHTISQNIDNLHFEAGSVAVTEIHGNRTKVRCIECGARWPWDEFIARAAAQPSHAAPGAPEVDVGGVKLRLPPECPHCAGIVKSDTVMFGEPIPRPFLDECQRQAEIADCCIIAGTSATVVPAAYFPEIVLNNGGAIIDVNTDETPFTPHAAAFLQGPAGELLPHLVSRVAELSGARESGE